VPKDDAERAKPFRMMEAVQVLRKTGNAVYGNPITLLVGL